MRNLRKALVILVLAAPAACEQAHSEPARDAGGGEWATLDDSGAYLVQALRQPLAREGTQVRSEMKLTPREASTTPSGRPYAYEVHSRNIDCRSGAFELEGIVYHQTDGSVVEENHFEGKPRHPLQDWPGTKGAHFTLSMCELAGLEAPLLPYVTLLDVEAGDWRPMGKASDGAIVSIVPSSASTLDGVGKIVTRADYVTPQKLAGGRRYQSVVNMTYFMCGAPIISVGSSDYYGSSGELLLAEEYDVEKRARQAPRLELTERIREIACAGPRVPAEVEALAAKL